MALFFSATWTPLVGGNSGITLVRVEQLENFLSPWGPRVILRGCFLGILGLSKVFENNLFFCCRWFLESVLSKLRYLGTSAIDP